MKNLVEYIVKAIVNNPDQVKVVERESVDFPGLTIIAIDVADEDRGVLIGKKGRTIYAIRDILKTASIRANVKVRIIVNEDGKENGFKKAPSVTTEESQIEKPAEVKVEPGNELDDAQADETLDL